MLQKPKTIENNSRRRAKISAKNDKRITRMSDIHDIFDGRIRIYRTTHSGDMWQMRMWISQEKKYIRKSLKTRDKEIAFRMAEDEYIQYSARLKSGEKLFSISAQELVERYMKYVQTLVDDKQIREGRLSNIKTHTKHYVEYVGKNTKIQNIDRKFFLGYRTYRQKKVKDISMTAVVNETISIKQMYRWANNEGLIAHYEPDFGKIRVEKNEVRRESFTIKDYNNLVDVAGKWYMSVPKNHPLRDEEIYYRRTIRDFIILMGNFGFRTGELMLVKYKDVVVHKDGTATVTIPKENTKVNNKREVTGKRGDIFTRRLEYSPFTESDNFVFSHFKKDKVITKDILYGYYQELMKVVKAKHKNFDDTKTLYSLRHFWITLHLLIGKVDVYKIARYAGTSLNQIQKHYDNMKDAEVSKEIMSVDFRFDEDNQIELKDNIGDLENPSKKA
jgi:integrase